MQKKSYTVNFGSAVTAFPKAAAKKIAKGEASLIEVRVLTAALMGNGSAVGIPKICVQTGLDENDVISALAYWRGVGVIHCGEEIDGGSEEASIAPVTAETGASVPTAAPISPSAAANVAATVAPIGVPETSAPEVGKKVLVAREMPKYTGIEISAIIDKDGGKLRDMIDACQQMLGYMFSSPEQATMVGLCDWLGLEADYVMTLVAYYAEKKPGCKVRYLEKAAIDLVNEGIETLDALNDHIRSMELYDSVAGKLRSMLGIGARDFTKKENGYISHWINDLGYGIDMIKAAYDVTCDGTSDHKFDFKYASKVLDGWHLVGVKTPEEAEAENERYRAGKAQSEPQKGASSGKLGFDPDEFMKLAVKRSRENMAKLK